jgi:hypothetical protein
MEVATAALAFFKEVRSWLRLILFTAVFLSITATRLIDDLIFGIFSPPAWSSAQNFDTMAFYHGKGALATLSRRPIPHAGSSVPRIVL